MIFLRTCDQLTQLLGSEIGLARGRVEKPWPSNFSTINKGYKKWTRLYTVCSFTFDWTFIRLLWVWWRLWGRTQYLSLTLYYCFTSALSPFSRVILLFISLAGQSFWISVSSLQKTVKSSFRLVACAAMVALVAMVAMVAMFAAVNTFWFSCCAACPDHFVLWDLTFF